MTASAHELLAHRVALASRPEFGFDLSLKEADCVVGRFMRARLTSAFQPLFDLPGGQLAGVQAMVRTWSASGQGLAPWELFAAAARPDELVALDRLSRTLHVLNFSSSANADSVLYLSVHPRLIAAVPAHHGQAFRTVLDTLGLGTLRVVLELPAIAPGEESCIVRVADSYIEQGFGLAFRPLDRRQLDWLLRQVKQIHTVRIDVARLGRMGRMGPQDGLLAQAGRRRIRTVVDDVRTRADLALAREAGASHVQGELLGAVSARPDVAASPDLRGVLAECSPIERHGQRRLRREWVG